MNRWIKRGLLTVAVVAALAVAAVYTGLHLADRKMSRQIKVAVQPVAYRDDAQSIERGRYLYNSRGCAECHGADGAGRMFIDKDGMKVRGANITTGSGGAVGAYKAEDWVRTVRHGVKPDGTPAMVMPSEDYNRLTDADLASLVAYVRQLPPVAGGRAQIQFPAVVRVLYAAGVIPDAAQKIDHSLPPAQPVPEAVSVEHGKYVAGMCIGCHGANLSGGKIPGGPPDWPAAANLTPGEGSVMTGYAKADQFVAMMRTGKRPDGAAVSPVMPFAALKEINDTDLKALHVFLKSLPPRPAGGR